MLRRVADLYAPPGHGVKRSSGLTSLENRDVGPWVPRARGGKTRARSEWAWATTDL
jgi:hypothetical protein